MNKLIEELALLSTDALYYAKNNPSKSEEAKMNILKIINNNLKSYEDIQSFVVSLSSIKSGKSKNIILYQLKYYLLSTSKVPKHDLVKLFLKNEDMFYLNEKVRDISDETLASLIIELDYDSNAVERFFNICKEKSFELLDFNRIPDNSIDLINNAITIADETKIRLLKHANKLTPRTVTMLINNSKNHFNYEQLEEYIPFASNDSLFISFDELPKDFEKRMILFSKIKLDLLNEIISKEDLDYLVGLVKEKQFNAIPADMRKTLFMLSITSKLDMLSEEERINLLNNIKNKSLTIISYSKINTEILSEMVENDRFLDKLSADSVRAIITSKVISKSQKERIFEYYVLKVEDIKRIGSFANNTLSKEIFMKIVNNYDGLISIYSLKIDDIKELSEEEMIEFLTNPLYYEHLDFKMILGFLNALPKEQMLKTLNNKLFLSSISSTDLAGILYLDFEDIIKRDYIFECFDQELLLNSLEYNLRLTDDIEILENRNVLKLLYGTNDFLNSEDLESIQYLIDYHRNINKGAYILTIELVESFTAMYKLFGIRDSIDLINLNMTHPKVRELMKIKDRVLQSKINSFRMEHAIELNGAFNYLMYQIDFLKSPSDLELIEDRKVDLIISYADKVRDGELKILLASYILIKDNKEDIEETKILKNKIRGLVEEARRNYLDEKGEEYNEELVCRMKSMFRLKDSFVEEMRLKYDKEKNVRNMAGEMYALMNSKNSYDLKKKRALVGALTSKINLSGLCTYDAFEKLMLMKILRKDFDRKEFLSQMGYEKPENFEHYTYFLKMMEEIKQVNNMFGANPEKEQIFRYLLGEINESEIKDKKIIYLAKEKRAVLKRYKNHINISGSQLVCDYDFDYNELECVRYYNMQKRVNKIGKEIFTIIQSVFPEQQKLLPITEEDKKYFVEIAPLSEKNFEVVKTPLSIEELETIFNNFDFKDEDLGDYSYEAKQFVFKNIYNIRLLLGSDSEYYVRGFGKILSNFDKVESICKCLNIDMDKITVEEIRTLQDYINLNLTPFSETIDKDIIAKIIYEKDFVEISDTAERVDRATDLLEASQERNKGTIPLLKSDSYEVLDYHDPRIIVAGMNNVSCFRVGAVGNDFISYCALSKNGSIILLYNPETHDEMARVSVVRRGNGIFMHQIQMNSELINSKDALSTCEESLEQLSKELMSASSNTEEPIEFVTITKFPEPVGVLKDKPEITSDECEYIYHPIDVKTEDYKEYLKYPYLDRSYLYESFYHNYAAGNSILITKVKENLEVKDYSAKPIYERKRKEIRHYDINNINVEEKEVKKLLYLYYRKTLDKNDSINMTFSFNLSDLTDLYIGEDWCIFINNSEIVKIIDLEYSIKSKEEVEEILNEFNRKRVL